MMHGQKNIKLCKPKSSYFVETALLKGCLVTDTRVTTEV